jgi:hypothetical protein
MEFPEVAVGYNSESITKNLSSFIKNKNNNLLKSTNRTLNDYNKEGKAKVLHSILKKYYVNRILCKAFLEYNLNP